MPIYSWPLLTIPNAAARFADEAPTSTAQALAAFTWQRVGDASAVAECSTRTPRRCVEHRARVPSALGRAHSSHLGSPPVLQLTREWPTDNRDTDHIINGSDGYREQPALGRPVVPVVLRDKRVRVGKCDRHEDHAASSFPVSLEEEKSEAMTLGS